MITQKSMGSFHKECLIYELFDLTGLLRGTGTLEALLEGRKFLCALAVAHRLSTSQNVLTHI